MEKPWLKFYPKEVPPEIEIPDKPIYPLLEDSANKFPDKIAVVFFGKKLTYRELKDSVDRLAAALHALGVRKGDRVGLFMPNSPQYVIAYFAVPRIGAVIVNMNPMYVEREIEYQLNNSGAETVIALDLLYPRIKNVRSKVKLKNVIVTNVKDYLPPVLKLLYPLKQKERIEFEKDVLFLKDLLRKYPPTPPEVSIQPDDLALLQYTGGTTGRPKGTMLTHRNIIANTIQAETWFYKDVEGEETILLVLPMFHAYGMIAMFGQLYRGSKMIMVPKFEIKMVLKLIKKYKPTLFPGVPTIFIAINNHPGADKYNISSIKTCLSAAAPLPVEVISKFEGLTGAELLEGFGLTEASPVTHINPLDGKRKIGSIGIPVSSTDSKIVDIETGTKELKPGEVGELIIKGPQIMKGYWNLPEATTKALRNGWLYTGDISKMDEDGYFYIVDRKTDMLISSGFNVYPREIEEVLYEHPKVKEAGVVGIPDEYRGESAKAFVVLKDGETATAEEIIAFCKTKLAAYKVPKVVEFRKELPKTLIGKVIRRELREEKKEPPK
jgi:long-chain acyl-CoA synthetase